MTSYTQSTLPPPPPRAAQPRPQAPGGGRPNSSRPAGGSPASDWPDRGSGAPRRTRPASSVPPAAEFLGYVGGILTAVAALYLAADWWDTLGGLGQVLLLLAGTGTLGAAAAVVSDVDTAARRLSTMLWWLTSATALTTTYLFVDRVASLGDDAALLAAGLSGFGIAGYQWRSRGGIALHLPTFAFLLVSVAGAASVVSDAPGVLAGGLWAAGAGWVAFTLAGAIAEQRTGVALGAVTVLGATQAVIVDSTDAGLLLALVTGAALTAGALMRRDAVLGGFAGLAGLVFAPQIVEEWLIDYMTGTVVALVAGLAMLAGCIASVVVARRRQQDGAGRV